MAVVIGLIAKLGEEGTVNTIIAGASDFLGAALIIVLARGITVVMKNTYMTDTVLHWMEDAVSGHLAGRVRRDRRCVVNVPIAFLVPSSSGHAALVMPILAPLADFAGVARSVAVTAYQSASGLVNLVTPTSAVIMGGLALSKVGYDRYLKFVWPFVAAAFVVVVRVRRRRGRPELNERRTRGNPIHHHRPRRRLGGRDAAQRDRPPPGPRARAAVADATATSCCSTT